MTLDLRGHTAFSNLPCPHCYGMHSGYGNNQYTARAEAERRIALCGINRIENADTVEVPRVELKP